MIIVHSQRLSNAGDASPSSGNTDRDSASNCSVSLIKSTLQSSNNSDAGGLGSLFSGPGGFLLNNELGISRLGE
jgi:hypothetical protein